MANVLLREWRTCCHQSVEPKWNCVEGKVQWPNLAWEIEFELLTWWNICICELEGHVLGKKCQNGEISEHVVWFCLVVFGKCGPHTDYRSGMNNCLGSQSNPFHADRCPKPVAICPNLKKCIKFAYRNFWYLLNLIRVVIRSIDLNTSWLDCNNTFKFLKI